MAAEYSRAADIVKGLWMHYPPQAMYTIKSAAAHAGISVSVARAWERRYGIVTPARTASGYRVYDDAAVGRLRAMRTLIGRGWSASTAAASLRELDDDAVTTLLVDPPTPEPRGATADDDLVTAFVGAAAALDASGVEQLLDRAAAQGSFERVAEGYLLPMMAAIGVAWREGHLHVAAERLASHAVQRRLAMALDAAGRPPAATRPILVGLPPGARHELGALAFAAGARRAGLPVIYLGPDLPTADWVAAVRDVDARAVVVGVVTEQDVSRRGARRSAANERPGLLVTVGGAGAAAVGHGTVLPSRADAPSRGSPARSPRSRVRRPAQAAASSSRRRRIPPSGPPRPRNRPTSAITGNPSHSRRPIPWRFTSRRRTGSCSTAGRDVTVISSQPS